MHVISPTTFITLCTLLEFSKALYFGALKRSRVTTCFSSRYYGGSELKLGQFIGDKPISNQLSTVIFERAIDSAIDHLEENDKVKKEWFENFLLDIAPRDDKNDSNDDGYEQDVMNKLIDSDAILIEHEVTSQTNTEVSIKVSHVVEPWIIAALLIDAKRTVMKGTHIPKSPSDSTTSLYYS